MILTRKIKLTITESNFTYYENLGYDIVIGEELTVPIELLPNGSHYKIKCKCDDCGVIKEILYKNYLKYKNIFGFYTCRKCAEEKRKKSLKKNHGVEYPAQKNSIKKKIKKAKLKKKYG